MARLLTYSATPGIARSDLSVSLQSFRVDKLVDEDCGDGLVWDTEGKVCVKLGFTGRLSGVLVALRGLARAAPIDLHTGSE